MPSRRARARWMIALAMGVLAVGGVFLATPELIRHPSSLSKSEFLRQTPQIEQGGHNRPSPAAAAAPDSPWTEARQAIPPTPSPSQRQAFGYYSPAVVEKKAVSSRLRLLFLVGLEGTGHHYLADVLDAICRAADVPCPQVCRIAKELYQGLAIPETEAHYEAARKRLRREMETLANHAENGLPEGKSTMVGFGKCRFDAGMMSYPNFEGPDKALQYVDFRLLAEEAERAGVDVRFVYLNRSARSILVSDTQHHNYGDTFMKEARLLLNNAAVIESTFQELDPGFTTCFRYEDIQDPAQAARVAQFLAPNDFVAEKLSTKMLAKVKLRKPRQQRQRQDGRLPIDTKRKYPMGDPRNDPKYDPRSETYDPRKDPRYDPRNDPKSDPKSDKEKTSFPRRLDERRKVPRYHPRNDRKSGSKYDQGKAGVRLRLGSGEAATENAGGEEGSGSSAMDMVVARLQQKLDKIERDLCSTGNDTISV